MIEEILIMKQKGWKHHEWEFAGHDLDTKVEYSYCPLCNGFEMFGAGKPLTKISEAFYRSRIAARKISMDGVILEVF